jgi:hypothetical protein
MIKTDLFKCFAVQKNITQNYSTMRIQSYQDMLKEYGTMPIDTDDLNEREEKMSKLKHSVIVEGNFLEFDNAEKWIRDNLKIKTIISIFYGKIGYDHGFMEYFFDNETECSGFKNEIPNIYTKYPNGTCSKSDGYDKNIAFA